MARPTDKDDKNPNNKKPIELDPAATMVVGFGVVLIVLIVSMIVMYMMFESSIDKKLAQLQTGEEQGQLEEDGEVKQEGILLDLGTFQMNLADIGGRKYLKVGVALEISKTQEEIELIETLSQASSKGGHGGHGSAPAVDPNAEIAATMERYKPAIRDSVISVLSSKTSDELSTPTGKEIAKEEILEMVNNIFEGQREVTRVSFGEFITQ